MHHTHKPRKVFAMLLAMIGLGGLAACHRHSAEERISKVSEKIASKLDFDENQKVLLAQITNEIKTDFAEEKVKRQAAKPEFEQLLLAETLDKDKVKKMIKERHERMNTKIDKYLDKVAALHKTLTPKQKNEIIEKMNKFSEHWE